MAQKTKTELEEELVRAKEEIRILCRKIERLRSQAKHAVLLLKQYDYI